MSESRKYAGQILASIATDKDCAAGDRVAAATQLAYLERIQDGCESPPVSVSLWHQTSLRDLTLFFLKCALAVAPAAFVLMFMYIFVAIFTQVAPHLLGLQ